MPSKTKQKINFEFIFSAVWESYKSIYSIYFFLNLDSFHLTNFKSTGWVKSANLTPKHISVPTRTDNSIVK